MHDCRVYAGKGQPKWGNRQRRSVIVWPQGTEESLFRLEAAHRLVMGPLPNSS
jgi:hypothetical protein